MQVKITDQQACLEYIVSRPFVEVQGFLEVVQDPPVEDKPDE